MKKIYLTGLLLTLLSAANYAYADFWTDLERMSYQHDMAQYHGRYIHQIQKGDNSLFSIYRLWHDNNINERRIAITGQKRELIRVGDNMKYYSNNSDGIIKSGLEMLFFFPTMPFVDINLIKTNYDYILKNKSIIAGESCTWFWLVPKNSALYTQAFCFNDKASIFLSHAYLKTNIAVERSEFTIIHTEAPDISNISTPSDLNIYEISQNDKIKKININQDNLVKKLPANFRLIGINKRNKDIAHYITTDGLLRVSLFIEPVSGKKVSLTSKNIHGALSIVSITKRGYKLTAVGKMPQAALKQYLTQVVLAQ